MANRTHVGQKFGDFSAFESAIRHYQNAENVQFYKQDPRTIYSRCSVTPVKQDTGEKNEILRDYVPLYQRRIEIEIYGNRGSFKNQGVSIPLSVKISICIHPFIHPSVHLSSSSRYYHCYCFYLFLLVCLLILF